MRGVSDGALQAKGGYELSLRGGKIALQDFRLVPRATQRGQQPQFDLVGADGRAWFFVDRVMHELIDSDTTLTVRSSDLRISAQLAQRLGQPQVAGWTIAEVQLTAPVSVQGSGAMQLADQIRWHGEAAPGGDTYQNDLFMKSITAQYVRCQSCTVENGSGRVVVTPSSTLRNNANQAACRHGLRRSAGTSSARYAASIPWYSKFSGNFAPYNNDRIRS